MLHAGVKEARVDLSHPLVDAECIAELLCVKRKRVYELARRPGDRFRL